MDQVRRMRDEALQRIDDAEILTQSLRAQSDSSALLRILGFEVLLKAAVLLGGGVPSRSHSYEDIWTQLPQASRDEILVAARSRMPGHADLSDLPRLLRAYRNVFEKGRYFYEFYEGWSLQEQREYGQLWKSIGAPVDEADLQYFPKELTCLIHGLKTYIQRRVP